MSNEFSISTTVDYYFTRAKKSFRWLKGSMFWSLPIKLTIGGFLAAIGGSSFIGFLSEYATYIYAISFGIRPPLEGVPYLKAGVTLISMTLLIGAALMFCSIIGVFKLFSLLCGLVSWLSSRLSPSWRARISGSTDINDYFKNKSWWKKWGAALLVGISMYLIFIILNYFFKIEFWNREDFQLASVIYSIFAFLAFATLVQPSALKWMAVTGTLLYLLAWIVFLFNTTYYAYLLRYIGYGGGLPISIELKDGNLPSAGIDENLYMIIRTTNAVITLDKTSSKFIEIPNDQIKAIAHDIGGLDNLSSFLPDRHEQKEELFDANLKAIRQRSQEN